MEQVSSPDLLSTEISTLPSGKGGTWVPDFPLGEAQESIVSRSMVFRGCPRDVGVEKAIPESWSAIKSLKFTVSQNCGEDKGG